MANFFKENLKSINYPNDYDVSLANDYNDIFLNQSVIGTEDYKKYMTKSLIQRGFLFKNSENIEKIMKGYLDELFDKEFRNIFLYDKKRDITNVYTDIESVKMMNVIGIYDLKSAMVGPNNARFMPLVEPFILTDDDFYTFLDENKGRL